MFYVSGLVGVVIEPVQTIKDTLSPLDKAYVCLILDLLAKVQLPSKNYEVSVNHQKGKTSCYISIKQTVEKQM